MITEPKGATVKRIETLIKLAKDDLDANTYKHFDRNGVGPLDLARAVDKIRDAEKILRRAYGD